MILVDTDSLILINKFRKAFLYLLLFTLTLGSALTAPESSASEFTVFGPRVFLRQSGQPITETVTFNAVLPGTYTLQFYNGGLEDDEYSLVSASEIFFNDVNILSPNELNQKVSYIEKTVTLQAVNEISVEVRGKPGGALIINIEGEDSIPPTISATVSPPANGNGWHSGNPTITFDCADVGSIITSCSEPVTVSTEGASQVVTGTAVDLAGNSVSTRVSINLDKSLPQVSISSPAAGNKLTQTDAEGRTTDWSYDTLGRVLSRTLPLGQQESSQYDAVGNRSRMTDFNGQITTYSYDSRDRLISGPTTMVAVSRSVTMPMAIEPVQPIGTTPIRAGATA